ncbi:MAG: flagellin [bacterium]
MEIGSAMGLGLLSSVRKNDSGLKKIFEKLSTGLSVNRASDDAAALAVAEQLQTQVRGFQQANRNAEYAQASLNISEGTGSQITSMLQRQRELAVQASNDTLTDQDRSQLNTEFQALTDEINRQANASQFNRQPNAAGTGIASGTAEVLVSANPGDEITMSAMNLTSANLGVEPLDISTSAGAQNAVAGLDSAIAEAANQRVAAGAQINRLEHTMANNITGGINTMEAESRLRDLDYAKGVTEKTRASLLAQTSIQAMKNFNNISRNNLLALLE